MMNISGIHFDDKQDKEGDIEVVIHDTNEYLDKKFAVDVIKHLSKVFKLDSILEAIELYEENNND